MKIVVDSWAWVELLKASESGRVVRERILAADEAFTPSIVLAELARKYFREGVKPSTIRKWLRAILEASKVVKIDVPLAMESAKAWAVLATKAKELGLGRAGLGDAIILATARIMQAQVVTGDPHFNGMPETLWIGE